MIELPKTSAAIESGIGRLHHGAQLCVLRRDDCLADLGFGALRPEHRTLWMSAVKPVVAAGVLLLWERGALDIDDLVAAHIPEFGAAGKGAVSLRHLLTHTGGFRTPHASWKPKDLHGIVERICAAPLEPGWVPGHRAAYHADTSWYILGELIQRLDGRRADQFLRDEVFGPLGMVGSHLGIPLADQCDRVAPVYDGGPKGLRPKGALNDPKVVALVRPGGNGRGPARDLARFYQALLAGGGGVLRPQTVSAMGARHRVGLVDHTFGCEMDWGLGVIVNSERHGPGRVPYGFGSRAGARAFGHGGSQCSVGFADPEHGLAIALVFDGMPGERAHQTRLRQCLDALYEDLGVGGPPVR